MTIKIGNILKNRYRIVELIGRGGMAEVYKVYDEEKFTHFAVKVLHEHLATDRVFLRRFQREAQTLIRLQHPNIVRLYGLEQDGAHAFMVMDYIDGRSLRRVIFDKKRAYTPREALCILTPVCAALQFAHGKGYIHCDLKPDNILVSTVDQVFLSDFGIARMMDAATSTLVGAGTPAYMAPELVRGQDPTPQTDIYALGVILYEMLSGGERPFTGEHARTSGSTSIKVLWEHVNLNVPALRKYNSKISQKVEAVVLRCLEKDPKRRYISPGGLLRAFKAAAGGKTIPTDEVPVKHAHSASRSAGDRKQVAPYKKNSVATIVISACLFLAFCIAVIMGISERDEAVHEQAATTTRQKPSASVGCTQPKIAGAANALAAYDAGVDTLGVTTLMGASEPILFIYGWYAIDQSTLENNLSNMVYAIYLNGERVPDNLIAKVDYRTEDGFPGQEFFILIEDWPLGEHEIKLEETFLTDINDGWFDFEYGSDFYLYTVKVSSGSSSSDPSQKQLVYREDFSVDNHKWMLAGPYPEDQYVSSASFENGKYVIDVVANGEDVFDFANPNIKLFGDYYFSVEARRTSGNVENACYGLILASGYIWEICDNQYFQLSYLSEEDVSVIEEWTYSDAISPNQENQLSALVRGEQLQLFINGVLVISVDAPYPTDGYFLFLVNMYEASSGTFTFDNVEIRMP